LDASPLVCLIGFFCDVRNQGNPKSGGRALPKSVAVASGKKATCNFLSSSFFSFACANLIGNLFFLFFFRLCKIDTYCNQFSLQVQIVVADVQEKSEMKNSNVWIVKALYLKRRVSTQIFNEKEIQGIAVIVPANLLDQREHGAVKKNQAMTITRREYGNPKPKQK